MGFTHKGDKHGEGLTKPRFEVLRGIQAGQTITQLSRTRGVSRQSVYKVINALVKEGLLEKVDKSFFLSQKGVEGLHSFVGLRNNLRQHHFQVKFKVLEAPLNWEKRRNEFRRLPYFNKTIQMKNNEQDLFNYGSLWIKTTTRSVIVKLPTIYSENIDGALLQTFDILQGVVARIENLFKIRVVKNLKANMSVISQEYAHLDDAMARVYRKKGEQLLITGEDGKIWMITDKSFNGNETEFIHTNKAPEDETEISKLLNTARTDGGMLARHEGELANLKGVFPAMEEYNKNLKLHIKVQEEQLKTQKMTQEILKKMGAKL